LPGTARCSIEKMPLGTIMIVCSCNVLSDHDVRQAVKAKARPRSTGQVYGCLGCSAQCGRCARTIRQIMDEALDAATAACQGCAEPNKP
jgi:bacterioferritin-associated ferredoxin